MPEQILAKRPVCRWPFAELAFGRTRLILHVDETAHGLLDGVAVDEDHALFGMGPGGSVYIAYRHRNEGVWPQIDRHMSVIHAVVEVIVPRCGKRRVRPPVEFRGNSVKSRTNRMPDKKMAGRYQIGRPEKRPSAHMIEVERRTCGITDALSAQPVDDMATLLEMRQERESEAKKPDISARHAGDYWKYLDRTMSMSR